MSTPDFYLRVAEGASGFFTAPDKTLDPHLFDANENVLDNVETMAVDTLFTFWLNQGYRHMRNWAYVWIAGSGGSYQWSADRGNGDLDILIGIDYIEFVSANPGFQGLSDSDVSQHLNDQLKSGLWPATAATDINGRVYEMTFYVNPGTGTDITHIHPYAAYQLFPNPGWDVRPPVLPHDPSLLYPKEWYAAAKSDETAVSDLVDRYNKAATSLNNSHENSPSWHNASAALRFIESSARSLFDDIHKGRQEAFSEQGQGYGDWHNFRWQAGKRSGIVETLHTLTNLSVADEQANQQELYGEPLEPASEALRRALMWSRIRHT